MQRKSTKKGVKRPGVFFPKGSDFGKKKKTMGKIFYLVKKIAVFETSKWMNKLYSACAENKNDHDSCAKRQQTADISHMFL